MFRKVETTLYINLHEKQHELWAKCFCADMILRPGTMLDELKISKGNAHICKVMTAIKQGCVLSSHSAILVADYILRQIDGCGILFAGEFLQYINFDHDAGLMKSNKQKLEEFCTSSQKKNV